MTHQSGVLADREFAGFSSTTSPTSVMGHARFDTPGARCDVAIVRQHTPVQMWVDSAAELLGVEIIGDRSVVVLGLTLAGIDMLMRQLTVGMDDLLVARRTLPDVSSSRQSRAGGQ